MGVENAVKSNLISYLEDIDSVDLPRLRSGYDKTIEDFYDNCIEPVLPCPSVAAEWHHLLLRYAQDPEAIFFIRRFASAPNKNWNDIRRGFLTEYRDGSGYVFCDNYFAHYFFVMALDGFVPPYDDFKSAILNRIFPYGSRSTKEEAPLQAYPKGKPTKLNANGWKLAHLFSVNGNDYSFDYRNRISDLFPRGTRDEWEDGDNKYPRRLIDGRMSEDERTILKAHFLRLSDPLNYFLVPKTSNEHDKYGNNIGEHRPLLNYVFGKFSLRYGDSFSTYAESICANRERFSTDNSFYGNEAIDIYYDVRGFASQPVSKRQISSTPSRKKGARTEVNREDLLVMGRLYLEQGLSFRNLEKRVLHIDSQVRGGGFVAKSALNNFGLTNENKGALKHRSVAAEHKAASGSYKKALETLYPELCK